jgi:hypothetical protein
MKLVALALAIISVPALAACGPSEPRLPDLPEQPDRFVSSVEISSDAKVFIHQKDRTWEIALGVRDAGTEHEGIKSISVGDTIEGLKIGAIRCSFDTQNAGGRGEGQYMWRGKWSCMAGRTEFEIENAFDSDWNQRYPYVYARPLDLN